MAKHTLYEAQSLLIFLLTFYGFNESKAILKVYNRMIRALVSLLLLCVVILSVVSYSACSSKVIIGTEMKNFVLFIKLYFGANISCLLLCHFREKKFNALLKVLRRYGVSRKVSRKIRNCNIFLALVAYPTYIISISVSRVGFESLLKLAYDVLFSSVYLLLFHCLPLCALPVLISVHYINHTVNERVEEIKKCKSPLKKARLTTRLILLSTRLNPLVKATNDYGAPLILMLKATGNMLAVILVYEGLTHFKRISSQLQIENVMTTVPPLLFFLIYLWYLRVAPSANQIPSLMARVIVENVMRDDQGMSRDPISRIQLLTTRLEHLAHLTHFNFEQEQLTVLGEAVDEADIFMAFVKIFDCFNLINSVPW